MKKTSILRYASIGMATLGLGLGVAAADGGTVSIGGTSNNTNNGVHLKSSNSTKWTDNSKVGVKNDNRQSASSGDVNGSDAASLGNATSGNASLTSSTSTSVTGSSMSGMGSGTGSSSPANVTINGTFNNGNNKVTVNDKNTTTYTDNSQVNVTNSNCQNSSTGSVSLTDVASGGNLTSGSASASNTTTTTISR